MIINGVHGYSGPIQDYKAFREELKEIFTFLVLVNTSARLVAAELVVAENVHGFGCFGNLISSKLRSAPAN